MLQYQITTIHYLAVIGWELMKFLAYFWINASFLSPGCVSTMSKCKLVAGHCSFPQPAPFFIHRINKLWLSLLLKSKLQQYCQASSLTIQHQDAMH